MTSRALVLATALAVASTGCVSTAAVARPNRVSLPILFGGAAADFFTAGLFAAEVRDSSTGGAIATGLAVMIADVAVGCILGGCKALRP